MSAERNVNFRLKADASAFTAAMRQVSVNLRHLQEEIGRTLLPSVSEFAAKVAEWSRIQSSRDTRQVPCHIYDHEVRFTLYPSEACPGCGAAL